MPRMLVFDTETGGTDPEIHSILSLGAVVWEDGRFGATFEVRIAEPQFVLTARAMEINKIDIVQHCKRAVAPAEAMQRFCVFLEAAFPEQLASKDKIALVGHNVNFDVGFLKRLCRLAGIPFEKWFSHRQMDTAGILRFLTLAGKLHLTGAGSTEAFEYFGIEVALEERHTALGDAKATALLLNKLLEVAR